MAIAKDMRSTSTKPRQRVPWHVDPKILNRRAKFRRAQAGLTQADIAADAQRAIAQYEQRKHAQAMSRPVSSSSPNKP